jgi:hypothetical protein
LRRTSSTLFGAKAKDPKSTQAHMRHADPSITLKIYQQAIPAEVKAAALALETDLLEQRRKREAENTGVQDHVRLWMGGRNGLAVKPLKNLEPPAGIEPATC